MNIIFEFIKITRRWVDNIKIDHIEIGWDGMDSINLFIFITGFIQCNNAESEKELYI
jgi:hypothetical protein